MLTELTLDPSHIAALQWFADSTGQEVSWPTPLNGLFLVNKAKGIHKPTGFEHALSIRQSLASPYDDALHWTPEDRWLLHYAHEGSDPDFFTNRALRKCMQDRVPVGVIVQVKEKPGPRYRVLGLGQVIEDRNGVFTICQFGSGAEQKEAALDVSVQRTVFDATDFVDARQKIIRAIATRRGQPAFRRELLAAYGGQCAVTGCGVGPILEAVTCPPFSGPV